MSSEICLDAGSCVLQVCNIPRKSIRPNPPFAHLVTAILICCLVAPSIMTPVHLAICHGRPFLLCPPLTTPLYPRCCSFPSADTRENAISPGQRKIALSPNEKRCAIGLSFSRICSLLSSRSRKSAGKCVSPALVFPVHSAASKKV